MSRTEIKLIIDNDSSVNISMKVASLDLNTVIANLEVMKLAMIDKLKSHDGFISAESDEKI